MAGALAACLCAAPAHSATEACQDFWQFANATWNAEHQHGDLLGTVAEHNLEIARQILEADGADRAASGDSRKIGDMYAACMDERAADWSAVRTYLRLARTEQRAQILLAVREMHRIGVNVFWDATSAVDAESGVREIAVIEPSGLSLPRGFYAAADAKAQERRQAFRAHVSATFVLAGETRTDAEQDARSVLWLETALARATGADGYHLVTRAQLKRDTPQLLHGMWDGYFQSRGFPPFTELNLAQPDYIRRVDALLKQTPPAALGAYLRWQILDAFAPWMPKGFADERLRYRASLGGSAASPPRWQRCVQLIDAKLGDALGREWVVRAFSPQAKYRAQAMVDSIVTALRQDIQHLPWMSAATRRQALVKLALMQIKIGYPDTWRSYASTQIDRTSLLGDIEKANAANVTFAIEKIGKPPSPGEFLVTPQTVNAYYSPTRNEIVVPAGILQPPLFDAGADADDAMNYGGVGAIIGHEITHGFDDVGRRYDEHGVLRDWWTPEDAAAFTIRAQCFADQFSAAEAGEAIADLGGLSLAYAAFERVNSGKARPLIDGLGPEQRFFLAFARVWAGSSPNSATDPHPPNSLRVNGTLRNMPEFAQAYGCETTDAMVSPESQRCGLW